MKSSILIAAVLALTIAGCTKAPPGPDYTAFVRKLAEVESRMETGIKLGDAAKMAVEIRTESALIQFTNKVQKADCASLVDTLDLIAFMDSSRLKKISAGDYDPLDDYTRWGNDTAAIKFKNNYQAMMDVTRHQCKDLRASLSPKTEQANSGKLPGK